MDKFMKAIDAFLWQSWTAIGVRGTVAPLEHLLIDPEGLIVMTSLVATDARLREEAIDWCARYFGFVAITRLKNISRALSDDDRARLHAFSAAVNSVSSARWPDAGQPVRPIRRSGKSKLPDLSASALAQLRYRAIFGTTARTEALFYLGRTPTWNSAADVARATGHKKRVIANALDELVLGGILRTRERGNRIDFRLPEPKKLEVFAGSVAALEFAWTDWARVISTFARVQGQKPTVQRIEIARVLEESKLDSLASPTPQSLLSAFLSAVQP